MQVKRYLAVSRLNCLEAVVWRMIGLARCRLDHLLILILRVDRLKRNGTGLGFWMYFGFLYIGRCFVATYQSLSSDE